MPIYTYIEDGTVEQGDIFKNIFSVEAGDIMMDYTIDEGNIIPHLEESERFKSSYGVVPQAIVLSNSCNIELGEDRTHTDHVVFAPVLTKAGLKESLKIDSNSKIKGIMKTIRLGRQYGAHAIPPSDIKIKFDWSIVDFKKVFVISWKFFMLINKKQEFKIRLLSPYREKLSNRFGNYISRVAVEIE